MGIFSAFATREFGQGVARAGEQLGAGLSDFNKQKRDQKRKELEEKLLELKVKKEEESAKENEANLLREGEARNVVSDQETLFQESRGFDRESVDVLKDIGPDQTVEEFQAENVAEDERFNLLEPAATQSRVELLEGAFLQAGLQDTKAAKDTIKFIGDTAALKPVKKTPLELLKIKADVNKINEEFRQSDVVQDLLNISQEQKNELFGKDPELRRAFNSKWNSDPLGVIDDIIKNELSTDIQRLMASEMFKVSLKKKTEEQKSAEESEGFLSNLDVMFQFARQLDPKKGLAQKMKGFGNFVKGNLGLDPIAASFLDFRGIIGNQVARTIGQERGNMTDRDRKFAMSSLPSLFDGSDILDIKENIFEILSNKSLSREEKNKLLVENVIKLSIQPTISSQSKALIDDAFSSAKSNKSGQDPDWDNFLAAKKIEFKRQQDSTQNVGIDSQLNPSQVADPSKGEASLDQLIEIKRKRTLTTIQ